MEFTVTKFPEFPGYTITEDLYKGNRISVYRAIHTTHGYSVVIKVLQNEYPTFGELVQFRNQYTITKNLAIAGILKPLSLKRFGNGYALVMEDYGGISLEKYFEQESLELDEILAIAIKITDILHDLHSARVIHKDIKPVNILIHPESKQVKLIDFSLASLLPKETQEIKNPNILEGTLAYIAPEQTGRMNRGIDYRTDFYSFGVTLYQLLTGSFPFDTSNSLELLHCHIAKVATPIDQINTNLPKILGDIVAKLMAKNAENRYQSALGIKHDLQQCLNQWQETRKITEFSLAQRDLCDRFVIPEKLYGREKEVQTLLDAFERVSQGTSELILVAGFSGIGKTAVVNEVHKPITRQRGYFIKGKFDQFNGNVPFSAFLEAFRSLIAQLLSESDGELQEWKTKILAALGKSGQVLIEVIPELEAVIGEQPPVLELSGMAAQNRFNLLFQKFIAVFTTPEHPLVIFLDDLQWADGASLKLLSLLMSEVNTGYLLVLGAYRDNEVSPAHPLMLTLDELRQPLTTLHTLTLEPLKQDDIGHLVADSLHCPVEIASPLSELVFQKTQGNPFFTTQFLQGLEVDGLITFNRDAGYWQCDFSQIRSLALTNDVVEFMVRRLEQLPQKTQTVLQIAACLGNRFDLNTLAVVCSESPEEVASGLWLALLAGLVIPENETYKFFQEREDEIITANHLSVDYRFLHDRVQQAAYALIPEQQKQTTHYQIGKRLLENISPEEQEEHLFDIVNQLNIGRNLITHDTEQQQLISLNLRAGIKAKSATAYGAAVEYFDIAIKTLPEDGWQQNYALALKLYENAAEAAYLSGNGELMEAMVKTVTARARTCLDTVKTLQVKMQFCVGNNQPLVAVEIARSLLKKFGIVLPDSPTMEDVKQELETFKQFAAQFSFDDIIALPVLTDAEKLAVTSTMMQTFSPAIIVKPNLFFLIVLAATKLSLEYGNSPYSPYGYCVYAVLLNNLEQDIDAAYKWGNLSFELLNKFNSKIWESKVYENIGAYITHGKRHVKETLSFLEDAYNSGLENGDFEFSGYALFVKCQNLYFMGQELSEVKQEILKVNGVLVSIEQNLPLSWSGCFYQAIAKLLDLENNPHLLTSDSFNTDKFVQSKTEQNDIFGLHYVYFNQAILKYLFGYHAQALEASELAKQYLQGPTGLLTEVIFYFYDSLIRLACAQGGDDAGVFAKVSENQIKMKRWADHAPMNFKHKYELVCAEEQRLLGDRLAAMDYYESAIAGAKQNEYIHEVALANELAARFYLDWGKEKIAAVYMQEAYYCYSYWGAKAKTNDLATRHPDLLKPILQQTNNLDPLTTLHNVAPFNLSAHSSAGSAQNNRDINSALDMAAILKSAQALSKSLELNQLLEKLAPMMLQISGAEKLVLLLPDTDNNWQARVTATPDTTELVSAPLVGNFHLPVQMIQYVQRTQEVLMFDGLNRELPIVDYYLQQYPHCSVLCLPLMYQNKLMALLYLEHHSATGVFSHDRITILNFLGAQAAISIENALLNQALEQKLEIQTAKRQESETRFQRMVENIPGVVFQAHKADGSLSFPYVSPDCNALYEVSAEAFMSGQYSLRDFEYSEDRPIIDQMITEAVQKLQPFDREFRIVTLSGIVKWVHGTIQPTQILPDRSSLWDGVIIDVSDRKQAELALQDAQAQFRRMTENVPGMIFRYIRHADGNEELTYVSSQVRELFEVEPEIALQNTLWDRVHPDDVPKMVHATQVEAETLQRFVVPYRLILPQKGIRWVQNMTTVERLDNGDTVWDGIVVDISDRKQAELALEEAQAQFRHMTENVPGMIFRYVLHSNGNDELTYVSSQVQQIFEVEPAAALQNMDFIWTKIHPDDIVTVKAKVQVSAKTLQPFIAEFRLLLPEKGLRWVYNCAQPELLDNGDVVWDGVVIDVSERKQAKLALEEEILRRNTIFNTSSDGIHIIDVEGNLLEANASFLKTLGYTPEEARDLNVADWDAKLSRKQIQAKLQTHLVDFSKVRTIETLYRHKNGSIFPVEISICAMEWNGEISFVCISRDISQRKQAEAELQRTNAELIRATRMKDEFLANMSHELRTPINSILGMTEILQEGIFGEINPQELEALNQVEQSGNHLLNLINDILDLSKITAEKIDLELKPTDVIGLCYSSLQMVQQIARKKRIQLKTNILMNLPSLMVDEQRIKQVIINLLSNAIKFTPESGQVSLILDSLPIADDTSNCPNGFFRITVSDTGIGISPENIKKLFQPFVQIDSALNRRYEGTGLGLALVKKIVELHGGRVQVESQVGVGSSFMVDIPWLIPSVPTQLLETIEPKTTEPETEPRLTNNPLVLLVEDDETNVLTISTYLEAKGYSIALAENGEDAIEIVQTLHPQVILMDIQMPVMDGLEATKYIRQQLQITDIPIIALTALAMKGDKERCLESGANDYLSKPVKLKQLNNLLQQYLSN